MVVPATQTINLLEMHLPDPLQHLQFQADIIMQNKIFVHSKPASTHISTGKLSHSHHSLVTWVNKVDKEKRWQDHLKRKQHWQQRAVIVLLVLRTKLSSSARSAIANANMLIK
jgi:hypothetical protein